MQRNVAELLARCSVCTTQCRKPIGILITLKQAFEMRAGVVGIQKQKRVGVMAT